MNKTHIRLRYNENLDDGIYDEFRESLKHPDLNLLVISEPDRGPYTCIEWLIPSLVTVYFAKSYFGSFLKEAGKDHYHLLKRKLGETAEKTLRTPRIEPTLFGTKGKIHEENPYSSAFSVVAELGGGNNFKLLLPKENDSLVIDYNEITNSFSDFVQAFHAEKITLEDVGFPLGRRIYGGYVFLHFNQNTKKIEWIDERKN